jgi:hypothetical protein
MLTVTLETTKVVLMGNVAEFEPGATVTVAGTVATAVLLLERVTTAPFGATLFNVTVPNAVLPLCTLLGLTDSDDALRPEVFDGVTVINPLF